MILQPGGQKSFKKLILNMSYSFLGLLEGVFLTSLFLFLLPLYNLTKAISLDDVRRSVGIGITYSGDERNLVVSKIQDGVYEIKAVHFACDPGPQANNCEPEKYEIVIPKKVDHIFGLGMQAAAKQVELADFLDTSFGSGHIVTSYPNDSEDKEKALDFYNWDIGRMRTPIFIMPTENLIVAYIQPEVKMLRLSRNGQLGCPNNSTCIVLKKRGDYAGGTPGPLILVKSESVFEAYKSYYSYLKKSGFFFKKPLFQTFGLNWETYDEYLCSAGKEDVKYAFNKYKENGLRLSSITIGSGYWEGKGLVGCGDTGSGSPNTDALVVSGSRYGGLDGITGLFSELLNNGVYPLIGMRHRINKGTAGLDNPKRIRDKFASYIPNVNPFFSDKFFYGEENPNTTDRFLMLDLNNSQVISVWVDILKNSYGPFRGIKEDDMIISDQKQRNLYSQENNFPDGLISKAYPIYNQKFNNDFLIFGRNDWFSVGTDAQNLQGYLGAFTDIVRSSYKNRGGDDIRFYLDSALNQVVSGYPHPDSEHAGIFGWPKESGGQSGELPAYVGYINPGDEKKFLRAMKLITFWAVPYYSRGFWHLPSEYQKIAVFYAKLRMRLQQYAYDQAMMWYDTGVPHLMQPLFIKHQGDVNVYKLYSYNNDPDKAYLEYMFGNALLVRPIFKDDSHVSVYFPAGKWKPFLAVGPTINGGNFYDYKINNDYDYSVFLKEGEILVIGDQDVSKNSLYVYVFLEPNSSQSSIYTFHDSKNGVKYRLQAFVNNGQYVLKNLDNNKQVSMTDDSYGKGFKTAKIDSLVFPNPGDLNNDGKVDIFDYNILVSNFGKTGTSGFIPADINKDGKVDIFDYNILISNFGK